MSTAGGGNPTTTDPRPMSIRIAAIKRDIETYRKLADETSGASHENHGAVLLTAVREARASGMEHVLRELGLWEETV